MGAITLPVWNFRKFGTAADPIHKSDLRAITGDYGCDKQFRYKKDALAAGDEFEPVVGGKAAAGNAGHETIARALLKRELVEALLSGKHQIDRRLVDEAFREEFDKEAAGREVNWGKDSNKSEKIKYDRVSMVLATLNRLHLYVADVIAVEAAFIVPVDLGDGTVYWLSGHTDLLYKPLNLPFGIGVADWKTGKTKPCQIELDHGWESGIYSLAVKDGLFIGRDELTTERLPAAKDEPSMLRVSCRGFSADHVAFSQGSKRALEGALIAIAVQHDEWLASGGAKGAKLEPTYGAFPDEIRYVQLQDFVPYEKAGDKEVKRPEDVIHYTQTLGRPVMRGDKVKYVKGDLRGPGWLPIGRSEHDVPRLQSQLRSVVGTMRMGRFMERIGEKCVRCPVKELCLTTGYEVRGIERAQVRKLLNVLQGLDDADDGLSAA
jgi:hypothetical protein